MKSCPACKHTQGLGGCRFYANRLFCARFRAKNPIKDAYKKPQLREAVAKMVLTNAIENFRLITGNSPAYYCLSAKNENALVRLEKLIR